MLIILLSLIIGFGIARTTNTNNLKFILTYSLLSFIIIVFVLKKSCKKCKDNKECTIEKFNNVDSFKKKLLKLITELNFFSKYLEINKNKEITQEKINEICNKIKRSSKLSEIYFKNTKNVLSKQKVKQLKKLMKKMKNKYKNLNKKDLDEKIKKFKLLNDKIKKQLFPELNFTYINSIIKDTSTKLQSHIMSKGLKPCKF